MQRLISLFASLEPELRLSQPQSGPPPGPPPADYQAEPEYFRHLLDYLQDRKQREGSAARALVERQEVFA